MRLITNQFAITMVKYIHPRLIKTKDSNNNKLKQQKPQNEVNEIEDQKSLNFPWKQQIHVSVYCASRTIKIGDLSPQKQGW